MSHFQPQKLVPFYAFKTKQNVSSAAPFPVPGPMRAKCCVREFFYELSQPLSIAAVVWPSTIPSFYLRECLQEWFSGEIQAQVQALAPLISLDMARRVLDKASRVFLHALFAAPFDNCKY